jgi:hypothetical protein
MEHKDIMGKGWTNQLGLSEKEALHQLYIKVLKYQTKNSDSNTNKNAEDKLRQLREKWSFSFATLI